MKSLTDEQAVRGAYVMFMALMFGLFVWTFVRPVQPVRAVPLSQYAGCYHWNDVGIELTTDGRVMTGDGQWSYRIIPANAGKHGDLIEIDNFGVLQKGTTLKFERWRHGQHIPVISGKRLDVVFGDAEAQAYSAHFDRVKCGVTS